MPILAPQPSVSSSSSSLFLSSLELSDTKSMRLKHEPCSQPIHSSAIGFPAIGEHIFDRDPPCSWRPPDFAPLHPTPHIIQDAALIDVSCLKLVACNV